MLKILVIDDDALCGNQACELLRRFGYSSKLLKNPLDIFPILEQQDFSLILLDYNMPEQNGLSVLKQIRSHPEYEQIPVIILTGSVEKEILKSCFEHGATDFLEKPIELQVMRARIKSALQQYELVCALKEKEKLLEEERDQLKEYFREYHLLKQYTDVQPPDLSPAAAIEEEPHSPPDLRLAIVGMMYCSLEIWNEDLGKSKEQLAEESGIWSVYMEKNGSCRTRTLDRYLCLKTLPKKPHWKNVLKTAHFVLEAFSTSLQDPGKEDECVRCFMKKIKSFEHLLSSEGFFV